jgi:membrane-bound lytic murein transglycosylase A
MALLRALSGLVARAAAAGISMTCLAAAQPVGFDALPGWAEDDHAEALAVFSTTCDLIRPAPGTAALWSDICAMAPRVTSPRLFFELYFQPVVIGTPPALFTAYYEPELPASRHRAGRFAWPIYAKPPEFNGRSRWHSRAEIEKRGLLRGRGLDG